MRQDTMNMGWQQSGGHQSGGMGYQGGGMRQQQGGGMRQQDGGMRQQDLSQQGLGGIQSMITSMIGFTNAVTVFSLQQLQDAVRLMTDPRAAMDRFSNTLNSLSESLSHQVDESGRTTLDTLNRSTAEVVDRSFEVMGSSGGSASGSTSGGAGAARGSMRTEGGGTGASAGYNADVLSGRKR